MKITIIRHAPTEYSILKKFMGGELDLPITEDGKTFSSQLGLQLSGKFFSDYFSSPMLRAVQTAKAIFPSKHIQLDNDLRERGLGKWTGLTIDELKKNVPQAFYPSGYLNPYFLPEGGEPLESVFERVERFLGRILPLSNDAHPVIVTHNGIIRIMRCMLEKRPYEEIFLQGEGFLKPITLEKVRDMWSEVNDLGNVTLNQKGEVGASFP